MIARGFLVYEASRVTVGGAAWCLIETHYQIKSRAACNLWLQAALDLCMCQ